MDGKNAIFRKYLRVLEGCHAQQVDAILWQGTLQHALLQ